MWALNQGRTQPDGQVMTSPDLLRPGWTVLLPADTTTSNGTAPVAIPNSSAGTGSETVTVHPGDTLSGLAAAVGQPDWRKAWAASDGMTEPGGARFTDPNLVRPGWTVDIPADAAASPAPATPPAASEPTQPTAPVIPTRPSRPPRTGQTGAAPSQAPATPEPSTSAASTAPAPAVTLSAAPVPSHGDAEQPARTSASARGGDDVLAFSAGGGLLAAMVLSTLLVNRRRQFRWRRPGRAITSGAHTPRPVRRLEQAVLAAGSVSAPDLTWLDAALRGLGRQIAGTPDATMPDVVAVRMTPDVLELILASPHLPPPAPWTANTDGTPGSRWALGREDTPPVSQRLRERWITTYPLLVSVGHTDTGEQWLLDLERIGALSLVGNRERCLDLARFIAAELAHNSWSDALTLTLAGFGEELRALNHERLHYVEDPARAVRSLVSDLDGVIETVEKLNGRLLDRRLHDASAEYHDPTALLVMPPADDGTASTAIDELLAAMARGPARTAVAVLIVDGTDPTSAAGSPSDLAAAGSSVANRPGRPQPRWSLTVTPNGRLQLPELGVELIAQQLPEQESAALAQMLALSEDLHSQPMPAAKGNAPYNALADAAGGVRADALDEAPAEGGRRLAAAEAPLAQADSDSGPGSPLDRLRVPPPTGPMAAGGGRLRYAPALHAVDPPPWVANSLLPLPTQTYLEATPAMAEDIEAIAPVVPPNVAERLHAADPNLEADVAAWNDPNSPRPKVRLLGRITVTATGTLDESKPRLAWNTEVAAYLATHPGGVQASTFAAEFYPNDSPEVSGDKVRKAAMSVRTWLGTDPTTGDPYLPKSKSVGVPGVTRYQVNELLVDADLFRRLRLRALARGADGIEDLWAALRLVTGRPFDHDRNGGYSWLAEQHDDHIFAAMIYDVAHTVAVRHQGAGDPLKAVEAAEIALRAGSQEDTTLLDLMFACDAQGEHSQGDAYQKRVLENHGADIPEDCPPTTAAALLRRERNRRSTAG